MSSIFPRTVELCFLFVLTSILTLNVFAQNTALKNDLKKSFGKVDVVRFGGKSLRRIENQDFLSVATAEKTFRLSLTPRDLRSPRYRAENATVLGAQTIEPGAAVTTYKGKVSGDERSQVRLNIEDSKIEGYFTTGDERYYIEPAQRFSPLAAAEDFVVYRPEDVLDKKTYTCHSDLAERIEDGRRLVDANISQSAQSVRVIELATEADYEFVTSVGSAAAANNKILSILNMVEGVYENELNLTLSIVFQHTWSTADPFNGANANTLLSSFQSYWNTNFAKAQIERDAAHLFSAKPNVLAQGLAFLSVICKPINAYSPDVAYGFSGRIPVGWNWEEANFMVTAHEIAHNLGANHAEASQSCGASLMNAGINSDTKFSFCSYSRTEIGNYVASSGSCMAPRLSSLARTDFDGDGRTDIAVWRPTSGVWYVNQSSAGLKSFGFGQNGDKVVAGDYDGDGKNDAAVYRGGVWYRMRSASSTFDAFNFGLPTDVPAPADYDGDGKTDAAVFRPSSATWYISRSSGGTTIQQFGASADVPVAADYDGDGKADIAIYRPVFGQWWINRSSAGVIAFQFGSAADKPVQSDFTGDGKADVAFFRPSSGEWFVLRSENASYYSFPFGTGGDIPSPGDYDGDGKTDAAVFRPLTGTWFANRSTGGTLIQAFGQAGDSPVSGFPNR